ncbi:MAG: hypothetical protein OXU79_13620 [Gemmatimonadota bacterium]|nr:hypothetical protein [Gemmatimonadota bacterium]
MLIYLNGSINSGESTIGRLLAEALPKTVHVEVVELRHPAQNRLGQGTRRASLLT